MFSFSSKCILYYIRSERAVFSAAVGGSVRGLAVNDIYIILVPHEQHLYRSLHAWRSLEDHYIEITYTLRLVHLRSFSWRPSTCMKIIVDNGMLPLDL